MQEGSGPDVSEDRRRWTRTSTLKRGGDVVLPYNWLYMEPFAYILIYHFIITSCIIMSSYVIFRYIRSSFCALHQSLRQCQCVTRAASSRSRETSMSGCSQCELPHLIEHAQAGSATHAPTTHCARPPLQATRTYTSGCCGPHSCMEWTQRTWRTIACWTRGGQTSSTPPPHSSASAVSSSTTRRVEPSR